MPSIALKDLLENFKDLADDEKEYFLEIAKKQLIEFKRYKIADRAKEAEENYKAGKVLSGNEESLLRDLEND